MKTEVNYNIIVNLKQYYIEVTFHENNVFHIQTLKRNNILVFFNSLQSACLAKLSLKYLFDSGEIENFNLTDDQYINLLNKCI